MRPGEPSRTARAAATYRAAHQVLDGGRVFADPLALAILDETSDSVRQRDEAQPDRRAMRLFIAARSRIAEDALAAAVARGTRQLVVLGAGLDTFAYRNPHAGAGLRVFEVDYPATQAWKRDRLAAAGVSAPAALTFAPVDFERQTLADGLIQAGFDPARPAFFTWLGVVPYLTREAIFATLAFVAATPKAEVVFDYGEPREAFAPDQRARYEARAARLAALGEPFLSYFAPQALAADLRAAGFSGLDDWGAAEIATRLFGAAEPPRGPGGHVMHARV